MSNENLSIRNEYQTKINIPMRLVKHWTCTWTFSYHSITSAFDESSLKIYLLTFQYNDRISFHFTNSNKSCGKLNPLLSQKSLRWATICESHLNLIWTKEKEALNNDNILYFIYNILLAGVSSLYWKIYFLQQIYFQILVSEKTFLRKCLVRNSLINWLLQKP